MSHGEVSRYSFNIDADAREREIGTANRENVQRFLSSLAVYPFGM